MLLNWGYVSRVSVIAPWWFEIQAFAKHPNIHESERSDSDGEQPDEGNGVNQLDTIADVACNMRLMQRRLGCVNDEPKSLNLQKD